MYNGEGGGIKDELRMTMKNIADIKALTVFSYFPRHWCFLVIKSPSGKSEEHRDRAEKGRSNSQ